MRTKLLLFAAACVLAAMSPAVGPATRNPVAAAPIPNAKVGLASYALKSIRPAPVMPDQMLPTILVPFTATLREGAPPLWEIRCGRSVVTDYLDAVGPFPGAHAGRVAAELASAFAQLRGRPESLRALVTHYPREDLAGRCVAIVTALHDLPDHTVTEDAAGFAEFVSALRRGVPTPGTLLEVRQVWQLAGSQPRLIEATVELTDAFNTFRPRHVLDGTFPDEAVQAITADVTRGGHFVYAGGGARRGIIWCDRSMGLGEPRPWSAAYRLRPEREFGEALDAKLIRALKQFVSRF